MATRAERGLPRRDGRRRGPVPVEYVVLLDAMELSEERREAESRLALLYGSSEARDYRLTCFFLARPDLAPWERRWHELRLEVWKRAADDPAGWDLLRPWKRRRVIPEWLK